MTTGLDGKVMTYDRENRPLSVTHLGRTTSYVYGADGARLKKIETDPVTQQSEVTLYMGPAEFRKWGQGNAEEILHTVLRRAPTLTRLNVDWSKCNLTSIVVLLTV